MLAALIAACSGCAALETRLVGAWECVGFRTVQVENLSGQERADATFRFSADRAYAAQVGARLEIDVLVRERSGEVTGVWAVSGERVTLGDRRTRNAESEAWVKAPDRALDVVEIDAERLVMKPVSTSNDLTLTCERPAAAP